MGIFMGIWVFCLLAAIVLTVLGIIFYFAKREYTKRTLQLAGTSFAVAVASVIIASKSGFFYTIFILTCLLTIVLGVFLLISFIKKNGKAKKIFKITAGSCAVAILFLVLTLMLEPSSTTTQTTSNAPVKKEQTSDEVKKINDEKVAAEAKKEKLEEEQAKKEKEEADAKKAEQAKKEAEAKQEAEKKKTEELAKKKEAEEKEKKAQEIKRQEEEKARKEAEAKKELEDKKKAEAAKKADEKRKLEAKKKEEAEKKEKEAKAKEKEKHKNQTFNFTMVELKDRWLLATNNESLKELNNFSGQECKTFDKEKVCMAILSQDSYMEVTINPENEKVKQVLVNTNNPGNNIKGYSTLMSLVLYPTVDPKLTSEEVILINKELGLGDPKKDYTGIHTVYSDGKNTYAVKHSEETNTLAIAIIAGDVAD